MKLGLALSGGSLRGMSHIGALQALEEEGIKPQLISGTSAGSIVAGLYASGVSVNEMKKIAQRVNWRVIDINYRGIAQGIFSLVPIIGGSLTLQGIVKGKKLEELFHENTKGKMLHEATLPLAITAVEINTARTVYFVSDRNLFKKRSRTVFISDLPISKAMRASISIPGIFCPVSIEGERNKEECVKCLVDGGLKNNVPVEILREMGADKVIAINLGYSGHLEKDIDNLFEISNQSIDVMMYQITKLQNRINNTLVLDVNSNINALLLADAVMFNPQIWDVSMLDFHRIPECIERGYRYTKKMIPVIKRALSIG